jgi:hypothetical protein
MAEEALSQRCTLALIEGFQRPRDYQAHGTYHAAYLTGVAIAQSGRYEALHLYQDSHRHSAVECELVLPRAPATLPSAGGPGGGRCFTGFPCHG